MDNRSALSVPRPLPPQRAVSGSALHFSKLQTRPSLPSRLSSVRSVSQPAHVVDLTADGPQHARRGGLALVSNQEQVYGSPGGIEVEVEDGEPPAKRAKTAGDGFRAEGDGGVGESDAAHQLAPGLLVASVTKPSASNAKATASKRRRYGGESAARRAHGIEAPPMATRLPPPRNTADFAPWTGHHPEDVLSDAVVKAGYCDKGPGANQSECNSAKPSIWPNLSAKNNMGLQTLSYLFTQVLEKRQVLGKCTAPSTFRPPPRVTVTDTKREAWLRDLANPDVPLRKQSRTIPHGIRGKLLMDQCLGKDIPLQRAVWLAKCVGANELRAFRRRGVSGVAAATGESKWVREWTVHVEQFLEGVIATCGQPEWQTRMNYAVKLATSFYVEKLLDVDHYLDWIVSSFAEASVERLPIWIVMTQIFWKDMVRFTRRGRQVAESILARLHHLNGLGAEANKALKLRLQKLIAVLAVTNRGCLIIPQTWEKYKYLLTPASAPDVSNASMAENLAIRNERLAKPLVRTPASIRSTLVDLYAELDAVGLQVDIETLTDTCLTMMPATDTLVPALLDWASSPYRHGASRLYLAARLISNIRAMGHDTDSAILFYLDALSATRAPAQVDGLYRVIGELVPLDGFSVGRYLQWLISSGALYTEQEAECATGLLAALPAGSLPMHVVNLRQTLLGRLEGAKGLQWLITAAVTAFEDALSKSEAEAMTLGLISDGWSLPVKVALTQHVRARIWPLSRDVGIGLGTFCLLRDVLASLPDASTLAELVDAVTGTVDAALLATATDTLSMHAESLAALGQLQRLTDRVVERYRALRSQQPLDRTFILAITTLVKRMAGMGPLMSLLANDLAICDQQGSLAVCSPASDSLIGMHASTLDSDDDIDAVFASGNSMDDQLMLRVFMRVVQRASKPHPTESGPVSKLSAWLNQLRLVGGSVFDQMVATYLHSVFKAAGDGSNPAGAVTALVASGCAGLDAIADCAKLAGTRQAADLAMHLLLSPDAACASLHVTERYRYTVMQTRCRTEHAETVLTLLCTACQEQSFAVEDSGVIDLVVGYATRMPAMLKRAFEQTPQSPALLVNVGRLFRAIATGAAYPADGPAEAFSLQSAMELASPLSVPFCAGFLEYRLKMGLNSPGIEELVQGALIRLIEGGNDVWPQLLEAVGEPAKRALHVWAHEQLLLAACRVEDEDNAVTEAMIGRYLDVLDVTNAAFDNRDDMAVLVTLAEKLRDGEKQLTDFDLMASDVTEKMASLARALRILLHICALHMQASTMETEACRQARGHLLMALCAMLVHPVIQMQQDLAEYIFDVASSLADSLPHAALTAIARSMTATKPLDARVLAILVSAPAGTDAWLALASQVQPSGSQQQRAIAKHPSQQGLGGVRSGVPGQTIAGSSQHAQQQRAWPHAGGANRAAVEMKTTPFPLRRWEIMPDSTPVMGENDTSLSLGLFGARKV
ncbi:hypothetical protein LTR36_010312 [Oleoguttula mirabilis]|uniref:Mediator of RNA polymerase II transcription subunit 12 n=1 Tax=Oleoguttula mirabilis TaxID=1507867 RepID=A0AAV9J4G7_9PEZI|nr:hypothetical protein LTR36_010312 [Oleoguttula mirabilis]